MILAVKIREKKRAQEIVVFSFFCFFVFVVVVFLLALMPHWPRNWERLADSPSWGWWWQWDAQKGKWGNLFFALTCPSAPPPYRTLPFIFKTSTQSRVCETNYIYRQTHHRKPSCTCHSPRVAVESPSSSLSHLYSWIHRLLICEALSPPLHTLLVPVWKK